MILSLTVVKKREKLIAPKPEPLDIHFALRDWKKNAYF